MARLPIPGQDDNTWGNVLNSFLEVAHHNDGSLSTKAVTDAGAYNKPSSGIPAGDLDSSTQSIISSVASKYTKPAGGIPSTDMASAVQTSLGKADTAEQSANKGAVGGYAALDAGTKVPTAQLGGAGADNTKFLRGDQTWTAPPATADATTSSKGVVELAGDLGGTAASPTVPGLASKVSSVAAADGTITVGGTATAPTIKVGTIAENQVTNLTSDLTATEKTANKGQASGYASLDGSGQLPTAQLPSSVVSASSVANGKTPVANNGQAIWAKPITFRASDPQYGVVADGITVTDAAITSGTNLLSSTSAAFTNADVGKCVAVMGAGAAAPSGTLSGALSTGGGAITSLPLSDVGGLAAAIPAGPVYLVGSSGDISQTFVTTGAAQGATSIPVSSLTPNFNYPNGTLIQTPTKHLYGWITSVSGGVATLMTTKGGSTPANAGTTVSGAEATYGTDDYTALQACITAAFAIGGTVDLPYGQICVSQTPTTPATSGGIRGQGCFELWGTTVAQGSFNALALPSVAPHFIGSVIAVMQPNIDGLSMGGIGVTQDLDNFGIRFAGAFSATGSGVNSQSSSQGLTGHTYRKVKVYGHDGNHYAFVCNSHIQYGHENLRWYGGGGLKHTNTAGGNVGNHHSLGCSGVTFVYGTANGIDLSGASGQWGLSVFIRPQAWLAYVHPALPGVAPPTPAQQPLRSNSDTSVQSVTWISQDFEDNVTTSQNVTYPVINCCIVGAGRKGSVTAANTTTFGGSLANNSSYQNTSGSAVLLTIAFTMNPTGVAAATVFLYVGPATNPNTEFIELVSPATAVAGEVSSATILIPAGYYFQYVATNASRNWNNAQSVAQ